MNMGETAEVTKTPPIIFAISGPSGAGKDYLQGAMVEMLGAHRVPMVTTRPARPEGEEKVCISQEEYEALESEGKLVGSHVNKGYKYGFRASDLEMAQGDVVIIELNPVYQGDVPAQLEALGFKFGGWFGLTATEDYLVYNMERRQKMGEAERADRLHMAQMIGNAISQLAERGIVTPFPVGMENRATMASDMRALIEERVVELQRQPAVVRAQ